MRAHGEKTFRTHDGAELFYRYWPAGASKPKGAIVLFHRGHEHSARMAHLVDELSMGNYAFFAWDARGHGRSPGVRGFSPSVNVSVHDVQSFIDYITSRYGIPTGDIAVVGQSVGAVLAATWVHDYAPKIRCMVLAAPAFKIKLYLPFARQVLRLLHASCGNFFVNSYVKPRFLTHDAARIASHQVDPLITRLISVNMLLGLHDASARVIADAAAITVPVQLLISGSDWIVHQRPQRNFFMRVGSATKERHVFKGLYHDTLGELPRAAVIAKMQAFLLRSFAEQPRSRMLLDADERGFTKVEADRLSKALAPFSVRALFWSAARIALRTGARFSEGIRLGQETGFDSGSTLDYVYRNHPQGLTAFGRFIDRAYLGTVGWQGIRQRRVLVENLLRLAMLRLREANLPVRIVDIAAGYGRYVLEALAGGSPLPEAIRLLDYSDINVTRGSALIAARKLSSIASFAKCNAFDGDDQALALAKPTLGVASGFYELFSDNTLVRRSLARLAAAIPAGGYLVYTNQPWHPQLELIARVLTSHRQSQAWVMRRRTQAEMDQLVEIAGFTKIQQQIDDRGIFTVSLAQRNPT